MSTTSRKPRTTRTPAERAQERVDVLRRRMSKLSNAKAEATAALRDLDEQIAVNNKRLDYALADPDIPTQPTTATDNQEK